MMSVAAGGSIALVASFGARRRPAPGLPSARALHPTFGKTPPFPKTRFRESGKATTGARAALPPSGVSASPLFDVAFGVEETFVLVTVAGFIAYIALNFEEIVAKQKVAVEKAMAEQDKNVNDAMAKQKRDIDAAMRKQAEATEQKNKKGGGGRPR